MLNKRTLSVEWTERSVKQTKNIQDYLSNKFSESEVKSFFELLTTFEKTVASFPKLYQEFSVSKKLRRAVLSRNLSIYYSIRNRKIIVVSVLDNRMEYTKLL